MKPFGSTIGRCLPQAIVGLACVLAYAGPAGAGEPASDHFGWNLSYDRDGRVEKIVDPAGRATQIAYAFDAAKRIRSVVRTNGDAKVTNEFDETGRPSSMVDGSGAVSYGYDTWGYLSKVHRQGAAPITYGYDTTGRVSRLQVGDFYKIDYVYDFTGRLETMRTPVGDIRYEYRSGQQRVVRILPNKIQTIWEYDAKGTLKKLLHVDAKGIVLAEYDYQYRPDGLIAVIREFSTLGSVAKSYEYDRMRRLVKSASSDGRQLSYEYDLVGNRSKVIAIGQTAQTATHDRTGRLLAINGQPVEHDASGNLTAMPDESSNRRYGYSHSGQLSSTENGRARYTYDGDGRLITRTTDASEATFLPDPLAPMWRPLVIDEGKRRTLVVWEAKVPLVMIRDGKPEYLLHDHLGSVRLIAGERGNVSQRFEYDSFGNASDSKATNEFAPRFAGLFWDPVARAYLTLARAYRPSNGRWLQIDPLWAVPSMDGEGLAIYGYCNNDPVNFVDYDGMARERVGSQDFYEQPLWQTAFGAEHDLYMKQMENAFAERNFAGAVGWSLIDAAGQFSWSIPQNIFRNWAKGFDPSLRIQDRAGGAIKGFAHLGVDVSPGFVPQALAKMRMWWVARGTSLGTKAERFHFPLLPTTKLPLAQTDHLVNLHKIVKRKGYLDGRDLIPNAPAAVSKIRLPPAQTQWIARFSESLEKVAASSKRNGQLEVRDLFGNPHYGVAQRAQQEGRHIAFGGQHFYPDGFWSPGLNAKDRITYLDLAGRMANRTGELFGRMAMDSGRASVEIAKRVAPFLPPMLVLNSGASEASSMRELPHNPSTVGGVYLGGAGRSLSGIGLIDGLTRDDNGNLILLAKGGEKIKLPPLRMDDVVTIFRSVYLDGEGPTVTIDPSPENPEGPVMIIKHSKATDGTYVGWILYQADRLMKGYTIGQDNVANKAITSNVSGFNDVLDKIYFGGDKEKSRKEGVWERFWIVPAQVGRYGGAAGSLTIFDVPLRVKTQKMKWEGGKLVDDSKGKSSPGAVAFTDWFTSNYDLIDREQMLTPPRESGIAEPVPVFAELRRVALITAIAEKLRDQGVPMPFWMRDYWVRPVPFEKTTPALTMQRSNATVSARIYGGVNLSVADTDVRNFSARADLAKLGKEDAERARAKLTLAMALEGSVHSKLSTAEPLKATPLTRERDGYQALSLPGTETVALGPARLDEMDLAVPVHQGAPIRLVRSYNSFHDPAGPWGKGWALELPQLVQIRIPVRRDDKGLVVQRAYELVTPLNNMYARFSRTGKVAELNGSTLLVPDQPGEFLALADDRPDFLSGPTRKVIRRDGAVWHFTEGGDLVAMEQPGSRVIYERDANRRLTRIAGVVGKRLVASIELRYGSAGRLESARAVANKRETMVRYEYDSNERLNAVVSDAGRLGYRYEYSLLTEIAHRAAGGDPRKAADRTLRRFQYGERGRLVAEFDGDGAKTEYRISADAVGSRLTIVHPGKNSTVSSAEYDPGFRPMRMKNIDGSEYAWSYAADGTVSVDVRDVEGRKTKIVDSPGTRIRTVQLEGNRTVEGKFDPSGRLISLSDNKLPLLQQDWARDGRLLRSSDETSAMNFEYGADGHPSRIILSPPAEKEKFSRWQASNLDDSGRPSRITDFRGLDMALDYSDDGMIRTAVTKIDGKSYGFEINRDKAGRMQEIKSSWGKQRYDYDNDGQLAKVEVEAAGQKSTAEWNAGLLQRLRQFDGGEYTVAYDGKRAGLPRKVTMPNQLALIYDYDGNDRLSRISVGNAYTLSLDYDSTGRITGWMYAAPKR